MSHRTAIFMFTASLGALMFAAGSAAAQQASGQNQLDEVVVTARRTAENLQSVPVTVQAFTAEGIRQAGVRSSNDLMNVTPGIYTLGSGSASNTLYSIRGQSKPVAGNSPAGVVSYFAEVPLPTQASGPPQFDLDNIQVLKGPQGTLFGRNTLGGAILTYPKAPTDTFGGYVQGTLGNYDWREVEGAVNLPIMGDKAALRVAARVARRDGYTKNLGGMQKPASGMQDNGVRVSLLLKPTEAITNTTIYDWNDSRNDGQSQILIGINPAALVGPLAGFAPFFNAQYAAQVARGPRVTDSGPNFQPREIVTRWGVTNRTEVETGVGDVKLINIFGYRDVSFLSETSIDGLPPLQLAPGVSLEFLNGNRLWNLSQISDEVQLRGTALDSKLTWLLGAFYLKEKPVRGNYSNLTIFGAPAAGYEFIGTESKALFGNVAYDLSDVLDGLKFNLGYRYTWDKMTDCSGSQGSVPFNKDITKSQCLAGNPAVAGASSESTTSSAPTWTVGLDYQATDDLFFYVTSRRGYRAGGVNSPKLGPAFSSYQDFAPETVTDAEIGMRSEWRMGDVTGRLNLSAFTQKNKRVQVPVSGLTTSQFPGSCVGSPPAPAWIDGDCNLANDPINGTLIFNTGETKVDGIEIDAMVRPVTGLTLSFTGSFMKQKVTKLTNPPVGQAITNPTEIFFQQTPEKAYTTSLNYQFPTPDDWGDISFTASYSWIGDINARAYILPAHELVNLRLDWENVGGKPVDVAAFVRNAQNNADIIGSAINVSNLPWYSALYNEPRFYGLEVRYRFGD